MSDNISTYFNRFYEYIPLPVQVLNDKGFVVYINTVFSEKWGYDINELGEYSAFNDNELLRNGTVAKLKNTLGSGITNVIENFSDSLLLNSEKAVPFFKTTVFPVTVDNENFLILFHNDQTEIFLSEEEVKKARDSNKEAERLKGTFLNVLSHELRTPLNIILGYSTIIKENLKDKISSEDKIYLDNLYSGSERLFKSITQMLEFAQIEAGSFQMSTDAFDIINVFKHCIVPHKTRAAEKHLDFKFNYKEESIFVEIDLQCTETAINHLLDNAVKFTRQGFIDIEINTLKERDIAICKIKDTGIGISTEYLDHLYKPFSQEDLQVGRTFEGNGLGLAISKRYIEKMGGSLIVDSIKGVGTTFTLTFPLSKSVKASRLKQVVGKLNGTGKILMLDDAGESYDLIKAFLKDEYEIKLVKYSDFNPVLLGEQKYNAVIFDVTKNFWDKGLDMCKSLKDKNEQFIPVLILSSEFLSEKIQQFYKAGADQFLVKPFAKNDLLNVVHKLVSHPENSGT